MSKILVCIDNNLSNIRKEFGWTQKELALFIGLTQNTISSIENKTYYPTLKTAFLIAKAFDCNIEQIFSVHIDVK